MRRKRLTLAADASSIAVMEVIDNALICTADSEPYNFGFFARSAM